MSVCSRNLVCTTPLTRYFFRIDVNLKYETYCNAISDGGEEEWDFGWSRYAQYLDIVIRNCTPSRYLLDG